MRITYGINAKTRRTGDMTISRTTSFICLMKLNFKRISLLLLVSAVVCLIMPYFLDYWYGYYGCNTWLLKNILLLVGLVLPFVQAIIWVISLLRKNYRLWTTAILVGLLSLSALGNIMPASSILIMHGMRNRIIRDYSLDSLRNFARDFDHLPYLSNPLSDQLRHEKFYSYDDLAKTGLESKYPFLKLFKGPHHSGPDAVTESNGTVYLSGNRMQSGICFEVAINGAKIDPPAPDAPVLYLSKDIFFSEETD